MSKTKWDLVSLSEVVDLTISSVDKKSKPGEKEVKLCNYMDAYNNNFIQGDMDFMVATATDREISKCSLFAGDVIITKDSETHDDIGVPAVVREDIHGLVCGYHLALLRPNESEVDGTYLFYALTTDEAQHQFHSYANGITRFGLRKADIGLVEVPLPPLPEQKAIAHILGTLDDKIELNRRMNQTLEAVARALFQDWFVDFGPVRAKLEGREPYLPPELWDLFPDRLVDSELGEIPLGWKVKRIEDVAERVAMGPFGSSIKVSTFVDNGIPIISGRHINGTLLEDIGHRFITVEHASRLERANVQRGDVIFTHAGNIGQVAIIPETSQYERYVISQRQFYMRCNTSKISPLFLVHFFKTQEGQHQLLANTSSTGVPSIARPVTYLRSIQLCVPPKALCSTFHAMATIFFRIVQRNTAEHRVLTSQRDALLPRLISGDLRIENEGQHA